MKDSAARFTAAVMQNQFNQARDHIELNIRNQFIAHTDYELKLAAWQSRLVDIQTRLAGKSEAASVPDLVETLVRELAAERRRVIPLW